MLYFIVEILIVAIILGIDQGTKAAAVSYLKDKPFKQAEFWKGFLDLKYSENTGASWGLFRNQTLALIIFTMLALGLLLIFLVMRYKKDTKLLRIPLLFVFAGGLGNLIDRFMFGYVRDFLRFTFIDFPIFNLADSAICVGAGLLIVYLIVEFVKEGKKIKETKKTNIIQSGLMVDDEEELRTEELKYLDKTEKDMKENTEIIIDENKEKEIIVHESKEKETRENENKDKTKK